jgi:uncharacterized iron-regulated protein
MRRAFPTLVLALSLAPSAFAASAQQIYHLGVGDPARRDREVRVQVDTIVDTSAGTDLTAGELPARLADVRLLLVGETHTAKEFHRVQLRVIQALHEAGRPVLIGLEMFPYTQQASLDRWNAGKMTEEAFVKEARWYEFWGYHWNYYRDIFVYARDRGIPVYAVNTPREVVNAVRRKGIANLTPEEAALVPPKIDTDSADHMTLFKASFDEGDLMHGGMSDDAWKGMLAAQATWDASMGYNAVKALKQAPQANAIMVVLVGSGHVAYGLGIERQARQWFDGRVASVIPVPAADSDQKPITSVQASYANFVWGVPAEIHTEYPSLGLSTKTVSATDTQRQVIQVEKESLAETAGFAVGDVILSADGHPVKDNEALSTVVASHTWGDAATFLVRRGGEEKPLTVHFRRVPPKN